MKSYKLECILDSSVIGTWRVWPRKIKILYKGVHNYYADSSQVKWAVREMLLTLTSQIL